MQDLYLRVDWLFALVHKQMDNYYNKAPGTLIK